VVIPEVRVNLFDGPAHTEDAAEATAVRPAGGVIFVAGLSGKNMAVIAIRGCPAKS